MDVLANKMVIYTTSKQDLNQINLSLGGVYFKLHTTYGAMISSGLKSMNFKIMTNDNKQQKLSVSTKPLFFIARVICSFFGHKWKYNLPNIPNKAMCTRCKCKAVLDLKKLEWNSVDVFIGEKRTDKELARDWV